MATKPENARYEARKRDQGWVRGPRITADAAEQLRGLAYRHRLTPSEVVSRLLLEVPLASDAPAFGARDPRADFQRQQGFSDIEMRELERMVNL